MFLQGETCKELKYSVDRLVKGLASSRQSARHGFSVALCQILRNFSTVTVDSVLQAVAMQLKYTQKESKSEQGNILLGKTLAYLALIQSGRLCQNQESQLQKVTKHLLEIKKKKSYLQQICTNAVALAISQVDTETFKGYIYPEIESDLIQGWEACTPDSFLLLLSCYKHQSVSHVCS
ncbi:hypothetical protein FSP39_022609 [Pinctada imbricata]|uniref:Uncharacterized protein n=1 Tax=Pinctada imbricata TaxID=66713 RepID=A0AA89BRR7_PINIB|nr:hypothetical protein FSP39_022609 [Pinctada imbricata]